MVQPPLRQRVAQGLDNMLLPHHGIETMGAVFAGENRGRHARILGASAPLDAVRFSTHLNTTAYTFDHKLTPDLKVSPGSPLWGALQFHPT